MIAVAVDDARRSACSSRRSVRRSEVKTNGWWTVFTDPQFTLDNYEQVISGADIDLATYLINSIVITIPSVLIPISLAVMAAYAFAWIPFKGRDLLFVAVFALQIVPIQVTMIPLLKLYVDPPFNLMPLAGQRRTRRRLLHGVALAHDLRAAAGDLPAAQLHARDPR